MPRNATHTFDGLTVGYGTHTVDNNIWSAYESSNGLVTIQREYILADLPDTFAATNVGPQDHVVPRGSIIKSAVIHVLAAADSTGDNLTVDIGTWGVGLATEVVDVADGIVADVTQAEIGIIGQGYLCDGTMIANATTAAVSVGATSNSDCVISMSYETAAASTGTVRLVVEYMPPSGSFGRVIAN